MRISPGDKLKHIELPAIDGGTFATETLVGRPFMLSFFGFAGCPFCNLRIHELMQRWEEFGSDFTVVAVFNSPLQNLQEHAEQHSAPFPILADEAMRYYAAYDIESSIRRMLVGFFTRLPTLSKALAMGFAPKNVVGDIKTMPADFLVDRTGVIRVAHYAPNKADRLPIEDIIRFSKQ